MRLSFGTAGIPGANAIGVSGIVERGTLDVPRKIFASVACFLLLSIAPAAAQGIFLRKVPAPEADAGTPRSSDGRRGGISCLLAEAPIIKGCNPARRALGTVGGNVRDQHVMFAFGGCATLATLWHRIGLEGAASSEGLPFSAGEALALFALFVVITRMKNDALFTRVELFAIAVLGVAFALPSLKVACLAMTATALMLLTRHDARLTSIGQLLLVLVSFQYFARLIFDFIAPCALWLETIAVTTLLSPFGDFSRDGFDIVGPNGFTVFIEPPCSAFYNITAAAIIWLGLIKIERLHFVRSDWWALAAMIGVTVLVNTIRITLMAQSLTMLQFWHDGAGVTIVTVVMLGSILAISLLSRAGSASKLA